MEQLLSTALLEGSGYRMRQKQDHFSQSGLVKGLQLVMEIEPEHMEFQTKEEVLISKAAMDR